MIRPCPRSGNLKSKEIGRALDTTTLNPGTTVVKAGTYDISYLLRASHDPRQQLRLTFQRRRRAVGRAGLPQVADYSTAAFTQRPAAISLSRALAAAILFADTRDFVWASTMDCQFPLVGLPAMDAA